MNYFWPSRKNPEGFSIENLAKKYREKISSSQMKVNNEIIDQTKTDKIKSVSRDIRRLRLHEINQINTTHWANRDFEEYRNAA